MTVTWGQFFWSHAAQEVALAALVLCSGFFSGSETALFSLTRGQLYRLRGSPNRIQHLVASLMLRPQRLLNTILMGNMLVNVAYASIAALVIMDLERAGAPAWSVAVASLVPLGVLILAGEVAPKMVAFVLGLRWAEAVAVPMSLLGKAMLAPLWVLDALLVTPLTRVIAPRPQQTPDVTAEELGALLQLSAKRGVISRDVGQLIQEIHELSDLRVRDIMVPRVDLISYDVQGPRAGLMELFRRTHLRKIPVFEGDIDQIVGVVHAKRLLMDPAADLADLVVKVPFVPEPASLEQVLLRFRTMGTQMGIVVDEYGGTAGLVTLVDVLEEIVGDIADDHELAAAPAFEQLSETQYRIAGDLAIHDWADAFKIDLGSGHISTVGGFITSLLGHLPHVGETVTYRNLEFTVESMAGRRIGKLLLRLLRDVQ